MNCYQMYLGDNRLGRDFLRGEKFKGESTHLQEQFLLVYHMNEPSANLALEILQEDYLFAGARRSGCYFLFVKGKPYGGIGREDALAIQREYHPQVHFLSYGVSPDGGEIAPLRTRWNEFFRQVEQENNVDWDLIDRDWPENLVATYLLARAMEVMDSSSQKRLLEQENVWLPVFGKANDEFEVYSGQGGGLHDPRHHEASSLSEQVKTCLTEINPHAKQ